eukprot:2672001-Prymnesium_polylepis.2
MSLSCCGSSAGGRAGAASDIGDVAREPRTRLTPASRTCCRQRRPALSSDCGRGQAEPRTNEPPQHTHSNHGHRHLEDRKPAQLQPAHAHPHAGPRVRPHTQLRNLASRAPSRAVLFCLALATAFSPALPCARSAAGKTTALYKLKLGDLVSTIPTIGFN